MLLLLLLALLIVAHHEPHVDSETAIAPPAIEATFIAVRPGTIVNLQGTVRATARCFGNLTIRLA